jgi:hypothetical protein
VDGDKVALLGEVDTVAGGLEFLGDTHCDFLVENRGRMRNTWSWMEIKEREEISAEFPSSGRGNLTKACRGWGHTPPLQLVIGQASAEEIISSLAVIEIGDQ